MIGARGMVSHSHNLVNGMPMFILFLSYLIPTCIPKQELIISPYPHGVA